MDIWWLLTSTTLNSLAFALWLSISCRIANRWFGSHSGGCQTDVASALSSVAAGEQNELFSYFNVYKYRVDKFLFFLTIEIFFDFNCAGCHCLAGDLFLFFRFQVRARNEARAIQQNCVHKKEYWFDMCEAPARFDVWAMSKNFVARI